MATGTRPDWQPNAFSLGVQQTPETQPDAQPPAPQRKRRSPGRWLMGAALVAVVLLVWLMPALVANSPLLGWFVGSLAPDLRGTVTTQSAALSWFSAPRLQGIEIHDERGEPVLAIDELRSDRSLLAILWDSANPGRLRLEKPKLHVVVRDDGSNLEDVLAAYLASTEPLPDSWNLGVEIVDGTVSIREADTDRAWRIEAFQLALAKPADPARPLQLQTSGTLPDAKSPGRFSVKLRMDQGPANGRSTRAAAAGNAAASPGAAPGDSGQPPAQELAIETEAVPLAMFQSILDRFGLEAKAAGGLSTDLRCRWTGDASGAMVVRGTVSADDLRLAAPALQSDQLKLQRVAVDCDLTLHGDRVEVGRLVVESDAGGASLTGELRLPKADGAPSGLVRWLPRQTFELDGRLDLARLAAMLPGTLRIREGTHVTGGQLEVTAASRSGAQGMSWEAKLEARDLAAEGQGRRIVWERPVSITLRAHQAEQGVVVERLGCESDFLKLYVSGKPEQLAGSASFDLKRLADRLGEFVDLDGFRLAGDGWAQFHWERLEGGDFRTDGELQVRDFALATTERPPWEEKALLLDFSARGRTDFTAATQVDAGTVTIRAGEDRVEARLTEPVRNLGEGGVWPLEVRSRGELARWSPRIGPWIAPADWSAAGAYDLVVRATGSRQAIRVDRGRVVVTNLAVDGPSCRVREPEAELVATGTWDREAGRLGLKSATLTSQSLAAEATDVVATHSGDGLPQLAGTLTYRGSLDRLQASMRDPSDPPGWQLLGRFAGKAELRHDGETTAATFDTAVNDLVATHPAGPQFEDSQVRIVGEGTYQAERRLVELRQVVLRCGAAGLRAGGKIALHKDLKSVQLAGQLDYDMEKLSELVSAYVGQQVRFAGRGSNPVTYQGPLALDAAQGTALVRWTRGNLYGFDVGPGELAASLSGGTVRLRPLDLAVSEGRVRLDPQVRLAPGPMELDVQPGRVADNVRINPRMCAGFLQYIAPALAGVAAAQGRFSLELDRCRLPLADPARGDVEGRMIVHSVEIGPGPMIYELAVLMGRAESARLTRQSVIPFRLADGRVHHRGMELVFPDLTIRTSGSVGFDRSLELIAEMPIPPKWRGRHEALDSALRNQTIRVPIAGTLTRPRLDRRTLDRLSQRFLENAAQNVIHDGVQRGLEELFGPAPPVR